MKQVRNAKSETHLKLQAILKAPEFPMSKEEFLRRLLKEFPLGICYISLKRLQAIWKSNTSAKGKFDPFATILSISMRNFFLKEIYLVALRSIRTTRKIKNLQIKQGKNLVCIMSECEIEPRCIKKPIIYIHIYKISCSRVEQM